MSTKAIERKTKQGQSRKLPGVALRPLLWCLVLFLLVGGALFVLPGVGLTLLGLQSPALPPLGGGVKIFDRENQLVATIYGARDEQPVPLKSVSDNVKNAMIAAEDHDFYSHDGINPFSICRAMFIDMQARHAVQGGSTISQQLVKNLYFEGHRRTFAAKVEEALMAMDMEHRYSKDTILEAYLNHVYFGNGVYGIQRAAEYYFGKQPSKLSMAESAFLAGIVNAPSELSRLDHRHEALLRQQLILHSMADLRLASAKDIDKAIGQKLVFRSSTNPSRRYRYYTNEVLQICERELNVDEDEIFARGYQIYSNLDPSAQTQAEHAIADGIRRAPRGINQGALVSISVNDGAIVAMVGGAGSFERNQWNRALSPHTAGSAFKPFVYLAALSKGVLAPDSMVADEPLEIRQPGAPVYRPRNFDGQFLGPMTIRKALALSRNTCAVRVAQSVGPAEIVECAHKAGITAKLDPNLALALGSSAVSPLEMANAYATLARNGTYLDPQMVRRICDANGRVLKEFTQRRDQVFQQEPVAELVDALQDVVEHGTGTRARLFDRPVAGKTGTSDHAKDIWFIGFTPDLVTAVWGGNDDNKAVPGHVSGGTVMAGIWQKYMHAYYQQHTVLAGQFVPPEHPLAVEAEPLHIMPAPASIFDRIFGSPPPQAPDVREYRWGPPPQAGEAQEPQPVPGGERGPAEWPRPRKKGLFRKLLNWLDF